MSDAQGRREGKKNSSFANLGFGAVGKFANVLFCGWAVDCPIPNAPKRRNERGAKKIKTPCRGVSKSINPSCLFIFSHCQVSDKVSQGGVWLAPNVGSYTQGRTAGDFLSSRKAAWAER